MEDEMRNESVFASVPLCTVVNDVPETENSSKD
jgi:hypothetical protein